MKHYPAHHLLAATFLAVGLVFTTFVQSAHAQVSGDLGLTAMPPRLGENFELKAKPGEKIQVVLQVRNSSAVALPIRTLVEDFVLSEDGSTPIPVNEAVSSRWSLAKWMTVAPSELVLQPRQTASVNVVIDVPADALPGGHYAMVIYQPNLDGNSDSPFPAANLSQTGIGQRVGTLMYFLVDGPIIEEAFIRDFSFPKFTEYGPVPFSFTVENVSDVHIHPQINVEIYNIFGQKVDNIPVTTKNVFPYVAREFEGEWSRIWGIGPYNARAVMSYGSQGQVTIARASFWLIPIKLVLAVIFVILSLLGITISVRRHLIHRQDLTKKKVELLERRLAELEGQPGTTSPFASNPR